MGTELEKGIQGRDVGEMPVSHASRMKGNQGKDLRKGVVRHRKRMKIPKFIHCVLTSGSTQPGTGALKAHAAPARVECVVQLDSSGPAPVVEGGHGTSRGAGG